jgi:protein phosphatase
MEGIFRTDTGKLRPHNEDSGAVKENNFGQLLAIVADGMGGHQAGDVASQMARDSMLTHWEQMTEFLSPVHAEKWLQETVSKVNETIYMHALDNPKCEGMGTTLVAVVCSNEFVTFSNVGDSRVYIFEDNLLKQMTEDHSLVGELVRSGQLSQEEADHHPRKNVLMRALGTDKTIEVDVATVSWKDTSLLLLCTDGLTNMLTDNDIMAHLSQETDLSTICDNLITDANDSGGEDNISISLVRHNEKDVTIS